MFENVKVGDVVFIEDFSKYKICSVEKVLKNHFIAGGIKFRRKDGRDVDVGFLRIKCRPLTKELEEKFNKVRTKNKILKLLNEDNLDNMSLNDLNNILNHIPKYIIT